MSLRICRIFQTRACLCSKKLCCHLYVYFDVNIWMQKLMQRFDLEFDVNLWMKNCVVKQIERGEYGCRIDAKV